MTSHPVRRAVRGPRPDSGAGDRGQTFYERAKHGFPANYPLVQFPNAPLIVALLGLLVARLSDGSVHAYARAVFLGGLAVWAWLEMTEGVTRPRRVLGVGALGYFLAEVAQALEA